MARKEVRAEVTGTIISVSVKIGDAVSEGQELAVIEAMKMEIPVIAPVSGVVKEARIAKDGTITENELSFVIEE